jgi:hypothetical protein
MDSIRYGRLDYEKNQFRLFTLLPRECRLTKAQSIALYGDDSTTSGNDNRVRGILTTVSMSDLNDAYSYLALSYTWGLETSSIPIQVDRRLVQVQENLFAALRYIQQADKFVTIWIDAICINQNDSEEKSQQVQMMREIYNKAVGVLVWLGPPEDYSDLVMDTYERLGKKAIGAGILDFRASDIAGWFEASEDERVNRIKGPLNDLAAKEGLNPFDRPMVPFSKRDYWARTWVLQEISVARMVTILCGSKELPIDTFSAAINFCAFARWTLGTHLTLADWMDPLMGPLWRAASGFGNAPSAAPNNLTGARRRYQGETGERESLRSLLRRTCVPGSAGIPLKATDPRDKIYSLLGLVSDEAKLGIVPDYGKTVTQVYAQVARALIIERDTTILAWCQQPTGVEQFPSWVPDFAGSIREPCGENQQTGALFRASGSTNIRMTSDMAGTDEYMLCLHGFRVDTIAQLGTAWQPILDTPFNRVAAQRLIDEVEAFCTQSELLSTPQQISDAKTKIPCADQAAHGNQRSRASPSALREEYERLRRPEDYASSDEPPDRRRTVNEPYRVAMGFQHDRKPFLSDKGYVGLAPSHSQVGDIVVILFGVTVPFVVRQLDGGPFQLVGEAYVYGIMDGEFLDVDRPSEAFSLI